MIEIGPKDIEVSEKECYDKAVKSRAEWSAFEM